jgi:hypothetical protein
MTSMSRAAGVQLGRLWRRCDARFDSAPGGSSALTQPGGLIMRLRKMAASLASNSLIVGIASSVCLARTLLHRLSLVLP